MAGRTGRPLAPSRAFWDTSALIPLCVFEPLTPACIALYKTVGVVVWWAAPVEIASALTRLLRMKHITAGDYSNAKRRAQEIAASWTVVEPSENLRRRAVQVVDSYQLRAADSFQLAAALEWCDDSPRDRLFLTADEKLRVAAHLSGFEARPIH